MLVSPVRPPFKQKLCHGDYDEAWGKVFVVLMASVISVTSTIVNIGFIL